MKRFWCVWAVATSVLNFASCATNGESSVSTSAETRTPEAPESLEAQRAANTILIKFVRLDENERYYLDINREDALKLGVPAVFYDKGVQDIETTNHYIQRYRWDEQWHKRYESFNKNLDEITLHVTDPSEWTFE